MFLAHFLLMMQFISTRGIVRAQSATVAPFARASDGAPLTPHQPIPRLQL